MSGFVAGAPSPSEPLRRFFQVARGAGLRVSAAEGIDAARAVDVVGFSDRTLLKDTLGLILAKSPEEKDLYDEAFELYFKRDAFAGGAAADDPDEASEGGMPQRGPQAAGDGMGGSGGHARWNATWKRCGKPGSRPR
jgi:uncharacterized protein with von Willebrand factor type A (vWA) domain